ncbi:MAG TPA: caspase family protein, partial [Paracoccaceae bacterium]|nr:caspase family protein [Paracoccaceae bacterium]
MSGRRRGLLIGNARFRDARALPPLSCPLNDVDGLAAVLRDPERGGFDEVRLLKDADSAAVRRGLLAFLRETRPEDTALLYYSGHGKLDAGFALHLCTADTEADALEATSVPMDFLWNLVRNYNVKRSAILLDCCYAGAAARAKGNLDETLRAGAAGAGSYLLAATDAIETAQEKEGARYSVFTRHLIAGIESGEADDDGNGFITMADIDRYVSRNIRADSPQRPTRHSGGHGE